MSGVWSVREVDRTPSVARADWAQNHPDLQMTGIGGDDDVQRGCARQPARQPDNHFDFPSGLQPARWEQTERQPASRQPSRTVQTDMGRGVSGISIRHGGPSLSARYQPARPSGPLTRGESRGATCDLECGRCSVIPLTPTGIYLLWLLPGLQGPRPQLGAVL